MKNRKRTDEKKDNIVAVSKKLFWEQGYENTTTRQISKKSCISTGLLFFYFKNKDELFTQILSDIFDDFFSVIYKYISACNDPLQRYSIAMMLSIPTLLNNQKLRRLYRSTLESSPAWMILAYKMEEFMKIIFKGSKYEIQDAFFPNILAISGAERALMVNKIDDKLNISSEEIAAILLRVGLSSFRIHPQEIDKLINQAKKDAQSHHMDFSIFDHYPGDL